MEIIFCSTTIKATQTSPGTIALLLYIIQVCSVSINNWVGCWQNLNVRQTSLYVRVDYLQNGNAKWHNCTYVGI